ncbi:MAG: hypothetical protein MJY43_03045 [Bacteroidales bacterium]|nr:hypothetical protein [Bacteroidales bacterium]
MENRICTLLCVTALVCIAGCSSTRKLNAIRSRTMTANISLPEMVCNPSDSIIRKSAMDTLKIRDDQGREMLLMKAARDEETGEMVAVDELEAVIVTATFRNVAERGGKVSLDFKIRVPHTMLDSKWQIKLHPQLVILGEASGIDDVLITGSEYRKQQLRGYEQYDRFISRIITDPSEFIDIANLDRFIERNIPRLYAFKTDSSFVSDEDFTSVFGVGSREAIEHYTDNAAIRRNESRKAGKERMFLKYIRNPLLKENIKLDTVLYSPSEDFTYQYNYSLNTRPRLRKAEIYLNGEIFDGEKVLYTIPANDTVTFYISSISMFADQSEHFKTKIIERKVAADMSCNLAFKVGKSEIDTALDGNAVEILRIRNKLDELLENVEYDLDSIVVESSASPDGRYRTNAMLSLARSRSISSFLSGQVGNQALPFTARSKGENWELLSQLIDSEINISEECKEDFKRLMLIDSPDARENEFKKSPCFKYVKDNLYPLLRSSSIVFHMHRKDMVKDTIHTTVLDTTYMEGVSMLKDMDYSSALEILRDYHDYNTAVAYLGLGRNRSALDILEGLERTAETDYLTAILYFRTGDIGKAVDRYVSACRKNPFFVHRGNLDPEISSLIKAYGLNSE